MVGALVDQVYHEIKVYLDLEEAKELKNEGYVYSISNGLLVWMNTGTVKCLHVPSLVECNNPVRVSKVEGSPKNVSPISKLNIHKLVTMLRNESMNHFFCNTFSNLKPVNDLCIFVGENSLYIHCSEGFHFELEEVYNG